MSIGLSDVSDDHVDRLCRLLARRPEYGIAIPSGRWLRRQEEKKNLLPKELLRSTNPLKRLAMKLADRYDSEHVDPRAVLCSVHQELNPFLIRRLFLTLSYEATVHTDALRSWQGRVEIPEIAALVGRVDSITALWTMPELFYKIYGDTPFEGKHIYVRSRCEACILAAIGANGQCLADLRAVLIDRQERRVRKGRKPKTPRFTRYVESWINQLKKKGDERRDRAAECRERSEESLHILRQIRPQVMQWRAEQKAIHQKKRASKQPIYNELRKSSTGDKLAPLSNNYSHKRRTRNGIPVALTDLEHAAGQRRAAMTGARRQSASIYRPDSLCEFSEVGQSRPYMPLPNGPRPSNPEPRMSGTTSGHEAPTKSFIQRFEHEISLDEEADPYDDGTTHVMDDIDDDEVEASRVKVENWYAHRLFEGHDKEAASPTDHKSVISMVHPAFRPDHSTVAPSAIPPPLRLSKDVPLNPAPSVWTDITVKSPTSHESQPPIPRLPSEYIDVLREDGRRAEREQGPEDTAPLNWPAPPTGAPPPPPVQPRTKPNHRKYLFPESCADSTLSVHQRNYIRQKKRMRDYPPEKNPFMRSESRVESESKMSGSRTSGSRASGNVPSLSGSHGDTVGTNVSVRDGGKTPTQQYYAEASVRNGYGLGNEGEQWDDIVPDESASNVHWRRSNGKTNVSRWPGV
ncbi:hypothetical protein F5Y18DRAFT_58753 [Xylariaceae sp. FL1019]|nr:hypothetical protein F5Y18DRAFT_58753 [Xylariaceae sp. FL1019]